jgi:hypothetical protein
MTAPASLDHLAELAFKLVMAPKTVGDEALAINPGAA